MKPHYAIKDDLFTAESTAPKIDSPVYPLVEISEVIDFAALAREDDPIASRVVSAKGGRPPLQTEKIVRVLVHKRPNNLSEVQFEVQLLDRCSVQRFCGLTFPADIPDRTKRWNFENRIGTSGATALFDGLDAHLLKQGCLARSAEVIDAILIPAQKKHLTREEHEMIDRKATLANWEPARRRQNGADTTRTKKQGKRQIGYKLSVNADKRYKLIRKLQTETATVHNGQHLEVVLDQPSPVRTSTLIGVTPVKRGRGT